MLNESPSKFDQEELGKSIQIESAAQHIDQVFEIAQEAKIDPKTTKLELTKDGFIIYPLDKDRYERRASGNEFFTILSEDGQIRGFLMCYDRAFLQKLINEGEIRHEDGIVNYLISNTEPEDNFLYGDQIGISSGNRTRGAGTMLLENVFVKMKEKNMRNMYVAILHDPFANNTSINFVKLLGFNNIAEVTNSDGLAWGIYHLDILKE